MFKRYKIEFMIPLFPLQIVVFPEEMINLHIFEPKYRQLVRDCMSDGLPFGIVPFINGAIQKVGTLMQINSIEKTYEDGRMDIKTQSKGLFKIEELFKPYPGKLYAGAKVRKFENEDNGDPQLSRQIYNQLSEVFQILNISKKLKPAELFETYQIGHYLGFKLEEEYQLLSIPSEYDRQIVVLHQLQKILPNVKMTASIKRKALMNGEFREIIPPEI